MSLSEIWYGEGDVETVTEVGEIWEVSSDGRGGPYLVIAHRGIQLAQYLELRAGELFFKPQDHPRRFYWLVLNEDRKSASLPDVVFIPEGVNQGEVFNGLCARLKAAA